METKHFDDIILAHTYRILIGLLFCTGLRIGEAISLNQGDFNSDKGLLTIRNSKWGKSRNIFLHSSTIKELITYSQKRDHVFFSCRTEAFFLSSAGKRLVRQNVHRSFQKCLKWANLYGAKPKPRIHDLRHTFIINTIYKWYQEGKMVEAKLPSLSTYVGHVSPSSTYWYVSAVPQLMACASHLLSQKSEGLK